MAGCITTERSFFSLIMIFVIITGLITFVCCSHHEMHIPKSFGTKLAYEHSISGGEWLLINTQWTGGPAQCWFRHVSSVIRHGARNPGNDDIKNVDNVIDKINKAGQDKKQWKNPFQLDQEKSLTELGKKEQLELGIRYGKKYFTLFQSPDTESKNASKDNFIFTSSHKERTKESMEMFKKGLSESTKIDFTDVETKISDNKLRFHKLCPKYRELLKDESLHKEYNAFLQNKTMTDLVVKITKKLGLEENSLTADDVMSIWVIGVLQEGSEGKSDWLDLFSLKDLEVLQYANDLKNFWRKSYGHTLQQEMSFPLLKDILHYLKKAKRALQKGDSSYPRGIFRSAHSETLLPLYGALGLFKDAFTLKSESFFNISDIDYRQFRTSRMMPFSANFALVLYRCRTDIKPLDEGYHLPLGVEWPFIFRDYMVQLFLNEVPAKFPFCPSDLCPYDHVVRHFTELLEKNTSFDDICQIKNETDELPSKTDKDEL